MTLQKAFQVLIKNDKDFQLAVEPESNIICFRFAPEGIDEMELNKINSMIRDHIIKEGSFYIVQTELLGKIWIRITIINPVTSLNDLKELMLKIKDTARQISI